MDPRPVDVGGVGVEGVSEPEVQPRRGVGVGAWKRPPPLHGGGPNATEESRGVKEGRRRKA